MNPIQQAILDRRSIRAYTQDQLTEDQLNDLIGAALASPSAMNSQPWHFTVVQDQSLLQRIHDAARAQAMKDPATLSPRYKDESFHVFYHAPTVIFLSAKTTPSAVFAGIDCGIAVENIAISAQGMGLGSVILALPRTAFMGEQADELRAALGFPEGYDFVICISVGTPADTKEAHPIGENKVNYVK